MNQNPEPRTPNSEPIRALIRRVRARWRTLTALQAVVRGALVAATVVGAFAIASRWTHGAPVLLVALSGVAAALTLGSVAVNAWPLRRVPQDGAVARFIEERAPDLDDRLASAVDVAAHRDTAPGLADTMIADAARRTANVDIDAIVPAESLRRAWFQAAAAALVLGVVLFAARGPAREAVDAASLTLFPERIRIDVKPGNARIKAGTPLTIEARLVGNRAPVIAQVQVADGDRWRTFEMATGNGAFELAMPAVGGSFRYRVAAGAVTSPTYEIAVVHAPRVARIDVDYTYPEALRLEPRTETDGGDIYAPAGTDVGLHVFTDRPAANGRMTLADGHDLALTLQQPTELTASLKVTGDGSYRIGLVDREGTSSSGDTEYFIRVLEDRPPEVRILKPATDRAVTRLEEVDIEAQAEDDYAIDRVDLVYSVRGGAEKAVPLAIPRGSQSVTGRHTLYLEDLNVQPGDFISYYVRARDLTRGTRPSEARSDIFFLEVKPYEQEFSLAQSSAGGMPGGGQNGIDDLVNAQKEIVVSTWKLDRRARLAKGAKPEQDIRSVARAEAELKTRVEQTSSSFRETNMRDPRRAQPQRGRGGEPLPPPGPPQPKAGETMPEEDHMTAASLAMGKAVASLDGLNTGDALAPEMDALSRLLKAQAEVKKREVIRQQAGSGAGSNRSNYDMSTLFDKELQKAQQTNYENRTSAEQKDEAGQSALDKIKELARRQDELLKKQHELANRREQMSEEEVKRALEQLTRDQSELRQKAEELARLMPQQGGRGQEGKGQEGKGQEGRGQEGRAGQAGRAGQSGQGGDGAQQMHDVSEEMRNAASELRRQDPAQASARGSRALEKLRQLQQQIEATRPDEQRRALGEMQLEARQLADAQRQLASELSKTAQGEAGKDAVRRLAGEQERLADRARKLQEQLRQSSVNSQQSSVSRQSSVNGQQSSVNGQQSSVSQQSSVNGRQSSAGQQPSVNGRAVAAAASEAAKELDRQKLAERMQQTADALRAATEEPKGGRGNTASRSTDDARAQTGSQQELARALDRVADRMAPGVGAQDGESKKLSDQRARAQELRDQLNATAQQLAQAGQAGRAGRAGQAGRAGETQSSQKSAGSSGRTGQGQQGGGGGTGTDLEQLRDQYRRQLQEAKDFMEQMRRDDPSYARGAGGGFTFEAPDAMTLSAPGTEAFKQDFSRWEEMRRNATQALENVESTVSKKLQAKQAKERLAAGTDDKAPAGYEKQVDSYFKAIAGKKRP